MLINDNDGSGRRGWMEYASGIGISKNVNQFAKMQFIGTDQVAVMYNGEKIIFDVNPLIVEEGTLVPVRAIFEKMGTQVIWDDKTKQVVAILGDSRVSMKIESDIIDINGKQIEADMPIRIFNERTFIPFNMISEIYDCAVKWNESEKTIIIEKDI